MPLGWGLSRPLLHPGTLAPQAWAEASGAYTPGKDKPDLPTWKRNFRSALNRKEGLRLADDRSKDPRDPHKVYEFVTPGVLEVGLLGEGWDFGSPQYPFSDHPFSPQEPGTSRSRGPLQTLTAYAEPLTRR